MKYKIKRLLPYLKLLKNTTSNRKKKEILRKLPAFVADDIVEVLFNILHKNVSIRNPKHRAVLHRNKSRLSSIINAHKLKQKRKQLVYKQSGGFIAALLPILSAVVGGLLGSTV